MDAQKVKYAVILAGGKSTRMGQDKALLPVAGIPMLQRIVATALALAPPLQVVVVGREQPGGWPSNLQARFLPDVIRGADPCEQRSGSPLVGLVTALTHLNAPLLLLPCDAPLLTATLLEQLLAAHARAPDTTVATLAFTHGPRVGPEPMLAVYTPALLPRLHRMLLREQKALYPLATEKGVALFDVPAELGGEMLNVNTPGELAQAEWQLGQ